MRLPHHVPARPLGALCILSVVGIAACTGSGSSGTAAPTVAPATQAAVVTAPPATPSPVPSVASAAPSTAASAAPAASDGPTAVPTAIDPCQLIPAAEAGKLAGASFGPGKQEALSGNGKVCIYGYQTKNVFEVVVAVAPDVATAQKEEASLLAELQAKAGQLSQGMIITKIPGFAPGADALLDQMKPNSLGIEGIGMNVLRGTIFFGFNDLVVGRAAPSADAMKAEAMTVLERLP